MSAESTVSVSGMVECIDQEQADLIKVGFVEGITVNILWEQRK